MKVLTTTCAAIGALALTAGAASAQPNPTYCHQYASNVADQVPDAVAGGIVGGAAGTVLGVVAGSILGQGKGAKVAGGVAGGVAGAAVGATAQKKKKQEAYNKAWADCMGQAVPVYYQVPPAGSQQWVYECSVKYKSFNADPSSPLFGTFQPYANPDGSYPPRQPCQLP
jgi:hypothetical protein